MRWTAVTVVALLGAGAVAAVRLRAHWIDQKIAAATVMPAAGACAGQNCGCDDPTAIVIAGDSRIAQWPTPLFGRLRVANKGIAGETALQLSGRFDLDVLPCHPRVVLIAAGINDLVAASLTRDGQARDIVEGLPALLIGMAAKAAGSGAAVFVATVVPPARPDLLRRLVWSDAVRGSVAEVNAALRCHAWPSGVTLLDFAATLDPQGTGVLPDRFRRDTLHFNAAAYACLTRLLPFVPRSASAVPAGCAVPIPGDGSGREEPVD